VFGIFQPSIRARISDDVTYKASANLISDLIVALRTPRSTNAVLGASCIQASILVEATVASRVTKEGIVKSWKSWRSLLWQLLLACRLRLQRSK